MCMAFKASKSEGCHRPRQYHNDLAIGLIVTNPISNLATPFDHLRDGIFIQLSARLANLIDDGKV